MDNFIVSARKYRPSTFDMVVGQDSITNTLKNAILNRQVAHAYLFCGPRGVGKTTCARIFAKTINCLNLQENGEACDKCESCVSFNKLRSFNIHELDAASNNKVDDIRLLTDQIRIPPQVGKFSIYIIDEVHMLSSAAFNAFLKTLEEPPAHAIFILATTEKHKIIPTILSRCQIFDFQRIKIEDMVARLKYVAKNESVAAEDDALHTIAQKADGSMRDALSIFDQIVSFSGKNITYNMVLDILNVLDYEYYFRIVDAALENNISKILITFDEVLAKGFDGHNFIAGLNSHLRNLLVSMDEATVRLLDTAPTIREKYLSQARKCSREFIYKALETGNNCDLGYKNSKNQRLHVELALIKLCLPAEHSVSESEKKKPDLKKPADTHDKSAVTGSGAINKPASAPEPDKSVAGSNPVEPGSGNRSVSIKELINDLILEEPDNNNQEEKKIDTEVTPVTAREVRKISPEEFMPAWKKLCESLKDEGPRISGMFKSIQPEIHSDNLVSLHLNNAAQLDLFSRHYKHKVLSYFETLFGKGSFSLELTVDSAEPDGIIYSDEQKYQFLVSRYPNMKDIRKAFNLDYE